MGFQSSSRQELHFHSVRQVVSGVGVERVTLHVARKVPPRVVHERERSIEVTLVGTTRNADSVVLDDVAVKQQVKPVGIAELCGTQVSILGSLSIWQAKFAILILVNQVIHLSINTRA